MKKIVIWGRVLVNLFRGYNDIGMGKFRLLGFFLIKNNLNWLEFFFKYDFIELNLKFCRSIWIMMCCWNVGGCFGWR